MQTNDNTRQHNNQLIDQLQAPANISCSGKFTLKLIGSCQNRVSVNWQGFVQLTRHKALLHLIGSCENRVRINFTVSCPNSINVDLCMFTLQPWPIVLYAFVCLCCHGNETMHQLQICPTVHWWSHSPKLHPGACSSVGMRRGTDRQTDRRPWQYTFRVGYASHIM